MKRIIEQSVILEVLELEDLGKEEVKMMEKALAYLENAYAPYSSFFVAASVLLDNGEILTSTNQENASFPVGVCAERSVLTYAGANFPGVKPLKIGIVAKRRGEGGFATVSPCGLCRQTISEYEQRYQTEIEILMQTPDGNFLKAANISQLLPFKFTDLNS
ncbi:cytidine deaminase [Echinicola pacifica]|uniref:Cytidine deaminase n=1 Tax=Echinicola pacifica TaxID=346377 RepID=A0A918Q0M9_9BACT|nr:cytidine deaminase [Echinicola pacifica]GGZ29649.1 cytidine deaminase [Echinicola pacifica]